MGPAMIEVRRRIRHLHITLRGAHRRTRFQAVRIGVRARIRGVTKRYAYLGLHKEGRLHKRLWEKRFAPWM